jgi:plasmid maintenance system antidote protein VapI
MRSCSGKRGITADTALRLARCFGMSAEFWLNLQSLYDLRMAERKAGGEIERTVKPSRSHEGGVQPGLIVPQNGQCEGP